MTLHLHPIPETLAVSSPPQSSLELGQMLLGTYPGGCPLHHQHVVLEHLNMYVRCLAQKMSEEGQSGADDENTETFYILADIIKDEALPALKMFLERRNKNQDTQSMYWQNQDIRRNLKRETTVP